VKRSSRQRLAFCFLLLVSVPVCILAQSQAEKRSKPQSWPAAFEAWLSKVTGINPSVYRNLARNRGVTQRPTGTTLVKRDLATGVDQILWQCGNCWSPILFGGDEIAVLREDGVWVVSVQTKAARQAIKAGGLREAISSIKDQPEWILLVRGEQAGNCEYTTWRANLRSGALERFGEAETTCLLEFDFRSLVKPDQVLGDFVLTTSEDDDPPLHVTKRCTSASGGESVVILPSGKAAFDPIWLGDSTIAYIMRP
jgi:hypothetical protein